MFEKIGLWITEQLGEITFGEVVQGFIDGNYARMLWFIIAAAICILFITTAKERKLLSHLLAYIDLFDTGKFRGLWKGKDLQKQIENNFYASKDIKMKVTRGADLLDPVNEHGLKKVFDNLLTNRTHDEPVSIKILLACPCFDSEHVDERYDMREWKMSKAEFIETWYHFLEHISYYSVNQNGDLDIKIRFYSERHAKWRFYICEHATRDKKIVLLSNYDKNRSGCATPMYKIVKGDSNIGGFMEAYFEEIWEDSISPADFKELVLSDGSKMLNGKLRKKQMCDHCGKCFLSSQGNPESPALMCKSLVLKYINLLERV